MTKRSKILVVVGVGLATVTAGALGVAAAMRGGPGFFFKKIYGKAKAELQLTPEQSTKADALRDRIKADWKASHQKQDFEGLIKDAKAIWLADKFDDAKADALVAEFKARREVFHQKIRAAVKELHGILDAQQRTKLVTMIETFRGKMKDRWKKHHQ